MNDENNIKRGRPQGKRLSGALQIRTTPTLDEGLTKVREALAERVPGISASETARVVLKAGIEALLEPEKKRRRASGIAA